MKEERSGPYLFPPLQLTKDPLEALVHVVELGGKSKQNRYSALKYSTVSLQATFLSVIPASSYCCFDFCGPRTNVGEFHVRPSWFEVKN